MLRDDFGAGCSIWPHYTRPLIWNIAGSTPWVKLPETQVKAV
jgi:hypothetical protein